MINASINLLAFPGAKAINIPSQNGPKKCVVLPISEAQLIEGSKGIYANLVMWEAKEGVDQYGNSHSIKLSPRTSKDMTQEQVNDLRSKMPYIGNAKQGNMQPAENLSAEQIAEANDGEMPF